MSINNKFNLGDRIRHKRDTTFPWMQGPVVEINAKITDEYIKRREVYYRIRPDDQKKTSGFHCTYPENEWELLSDSKVQEE